LYCRRGKVNRALRWLGVFPSNNCTDFIGAVYTHLNNQDIKEIILKRIYDIKEPTVEERKKLEKEMKQVQKKFVEHQERLVELEQKEARRKEADKIINSLTKDPKNLKLIAKALAKLGLDDRLMEI
jgi:S-adenosylmethionine synthetase